MAADNHQFRKIESDLVDVGDRPADFGGHQGAGVPDLGTEGDSQLNARGEERVEAAVGRRGLPEPWQLAKALEALVLDPAASARLEEASRGTLKA